MSFHKIAPVAKKNTKATPVPKAQQKKAAQREQP